VAGEGLLPAEVLKSYLGKMASMREELQSVLREKMQIESLMQEAASQHARVETALRTQLAGACFCSVPLPGGVVDKRCDILQMPRGRTKKNPTNMRSAS
jgi:hypothetical protein